MRGFGVFLQSAHLKDVPISRVSQERSIVTDQSLITAAEYLFVKNEHNNYESPFTEDKVCNTVIRPISLTHDIDSCY